MDSDSQILQKPCAYINQCFRWAWKLTIIKDPCDSSIWNFVDSPSPLTSTPSSQIFRCVFGNGDGTRLWVGDSGAHCLYFPQPIYECHGTYFSFPALIYVMLFFWCFIKKKNWLVFENVVVFAAMDARRDPRASSCMVWLTDAKPWTGELDVWATIMSTDTINFKKLWCKSVFIMNLETYWISICLSSRMHLVIRVLRASSKPTSLMENAAHKVISNNTKASWILGFQFHTQM